MLSRTMISPVSLHACVKALGQVLTMLKTLRQASRAMRPMTATIPKYQPIPFIPLQNRHLSTETRAAIDKAVGSNPVVLFMKGTPEMPQCGFSRASIQILSLQGVDPSKFSAFNVLEDQELRQGLCYRYGRSMAGY